MSRPVNHGQFVKGRSGNPGGRPRKAKQVPAVTSAFDIVIAKRLTITQGGVARWLSGHFSGVGQSIALASMVAQPR